MNTLPLIPADVPHKKHDIFVENYTTITHTTERLFLFSCDHKIEHLNHDFYGPLIHHHALHPEHLFRIAHQGSIGAMATHLGLIMRYATQYSTINYIAKLNGHSSLVNTDIDDPNSMILWKIEDVMTIKNETNIPIRGIGITVYLGSRYEAQLLAQAAQTIYKAHREGLVTVVWIYLRGKSVTHDNDPNLIAGAAGVGLSLGADFIKIKVPAQTTTLTSDQALKIVTSAGGNAKVICSGGEKTTIEHYLQTLYNQIHCGDSAGTATGRNIFQLPLNQAIALTNAISAIVYKNEDVKTALSLYKTEEEQKLTHIAP